MSSDLKKMASFLCIPLTLALPSIAFAASEARNPTIPPVGAGITGLIFWICYWRRHHAIGGWLLLFFIQLYAGGSLSIIITAASLENFRPSTWQGTGLYYFSLLSIVPQLIVVVAQCVIASALLIAREWKWITSMKVVLLVDLGMVALAFVIDLKYFQENIGFDILGFIWPLIWLPYLSVSKRVKRVFKSKDWYSEVVPSS